MNKVPIRDIFVPALGQDKVNRLPMVLPVNTAIILSFLSLPQAVITVDSVSNTRIF